LINFTSVLVRFEKKRKRTKESVTENNKINKIRELHYMEACRPLSWDCWLRTGEDKNVKEKWRRLSGSYFLSIPVNTRLGPRFSYYRRWGLPKSANVTVRDLLRLLKDFIQVNPT
jgi:hypothetical protein